ncbi:MAG: hypothetical protein KDA72_02750 [Planctomycetales bacterium]|nr:hypothetical protein [Planctomycetales bacterium]
MAGLGQRAGTNGGTTVVQNPVTAAHGQCGSNPQAVSASVRAGSTNSTLTPSDSFGQPFAADDRLHWNRLVMMGSLACPCTTFQIRGN